MLKTPSSRRKKKDPEKLNLIPIMDSVFIFIFFLLMSAQFVRIMEVGSDVPLISTAEPPKKEKDPLALGLKVQKDQLVLTKGASQSVVKSFGRNSEGEYDLESLHTMLLDFKRKFLDESTILLEPSKNVSYDDLIKVMDTVRQIRKTDEPIYKKDKDGLDVKVEALFDKIVFTNLMS